MLLKLFDLRLHLLDEGCAFIFVFLLPNLLHFLPQLFDLLAEVVLKAHLQRVLEIVVLECAACDLAPLSLIELKAFVEALTLLQVLGELALAAVLDSFVEHMDLLFELEGDLKLFAKLYKGAQSDLGVLLGDRAETLLFLADLVRAQPHEGFENYHEVVRAVPVAHETCFSGHCWHARTIAKFLLPHYK